MSDMMLIKSWILTEYLSAKDSPDVTSLVMTHHSILTKLLTFFSLSIRHIYANTSDDGKKINKEKKYRPKIALNNKEIFTRLPMDHLSFLSSGDEFLSCFDVTNVCLWLQRAVVLFLGQLRVELYQQWRGNHVMLGQPETFAMNEFYFRLSQSNFLFRQWKRNSENTVLSVWMDLHHREMAKLPQKNIKCGTKL